MSEYEQDHLVENIQALAKEYGLCDCRPCQLMRANDDLARQLKREQDLTASTAALMAQIRVEKEHLAEQLKTLREDAALRREVYGT